MLKDKLNRWKPSPFLHRKSDKLDEKDWKKMAKVLKKAAKGSEKVEHFIGKAMTSKTKKRKLKDDKSSGPSGLALFLPKAEIKEKKKKPTPVAAPAKAKAMAAGGGGASKKKAEEEKKEKAEKVVAEKKPENEVSFGQKLAAGLTIILIMLILYFILG